MNFYGNLNIVQELKFYLANPKPSYIFYGQKGLGKATLGKYFAKMLLCLTKKNNCDCSSCLRFNNNSHPDFIEIKPDGSSIKINAIRNLIDEVYRRPILSNRKVIFIDDSNTLTIEAQNALLKTLEESFNYITFIFIAHKELLTTIKSRSVMLKFNPLSPSIIRKTVSIVEQPLTRDILVASTKSIGRATELANDDIFINLSNNILKQLCNMPNTTIETYLDVFGMYREKDKNNVFDSKYLDEILNLISTFIFDIIRYKVHDYSRIVFKSLDRNLLNKNYINVSLNKLDLIYSSILKIKEDKDKNLLTKDDLLIMLINMIKVVKAC